MQETTVKRLCYQRARWGSMPESPLWFQSEDSMAINSGNEPTAHRVQKWWLSPIFKMVDAPLSKPPPGELHGSPCKLRTQANYQNNYSNSSLSQ